MKEILNFLLLVLIELSKKFIKCDIRLETRENPRDV